MNVNSASDTGKYRKSDISSRHEIIYEDDGFFSDVPGSGSLSKSLIALNKYVKKNLLYDETEEYENDSVYFSKESSPNESRIKYDSDSLKSNESVEDKSATKRTTATITYGVTSVTQLTDDYKSMQLQDKSFNDSDTNYDTISDNVDTQSITISEIVSKSNDNENEPKYQPEHNSVSMNNLSNIAVEDIATNIGDQVVYRHKPTNLKKEEYRHTLHEFNEWGNRTNIYPDVYAPLPYSEYRHIHSQYCDFFVLRFFMAISTVTNKAIVFSRL